jgi:hypothetical protein
MMIKYDILLVNGNFKLEVMLGLRRVALIISRLSAQSLEMGRYSRLQLCGAT